MSMRLEAKPTHRVIGVAPGHSGWRGRTVELGLCYNEQHANRCASFWYPHYDDIKVIKLTD
jgi:hypothetical protein